MSYIYKDVSKLEAKPKVGTFQCVALIRRFTNAPPASTWLQGEQVMGNANIQKGTAIATFVDGKYPNLSAGNHAAFFLRFSAGGIWVMDQWKNSRDKPLISSRFIKVKPPGFDASNNASAYSIIE